MAVSFFSPKGRMQVSRPVATVMNTMNILAPVLLLAALLPAILGCYGGYPESVNNLLFIYAAILVTLTMAVRIVWGILIHIIKKRTKR